MAILVVTNLEAQQRAPKLVVCITVDQLRGDYIEYFYNTFGEKGFKRLLNEGLVYSNIRFDFSNLDQASAFATLFTGSNPCFHGISGEKVYDFDNDKEISILWDNQFIGNYTKDNFSPKHLYSSTIGDELKIASLPTQKRPSCRLVMLPTELFGSTTSTVNGLPPPITKGFPGTWTVTTMVRNRCLHAWKVWCGPHPCPQINIRHSLIC